MDSDIEKQIEKIDNYISKITDHYNDIKKQYVKELTKAKSIRKKLLSKELNMSIPNIF